MTPLTQAPMALTPLFGFLIDEIGTGALYVSSGLSLAALAAFCILRAGKGT